MEGAERLAPTAIYADRRGKITAFPPAIEPASIDPALPALLPSARLKGPPEPSHASASAAPNPGSLRHPRAARGAVRVRERGYTTSRSCTDRLQRLQQAAAECCLDRYRAAVLCLRPATRCQRRRSHQSCLCLAPDGAGAAAGRRRLRPRRLLHRQCIRHRPGRRTDRGSQRHAVDHRCARGARRLRRGLGHPPAGRVWQ